MEEKSESRKPKAEEKLKRKIQISKPDRPKVLDFDFRFLNSFRISDFGFRISLSKLLQAILVIVSGVQILRCTGPAYIWVGVALIVPFFRLSLSIEYRRRAWSRLLLEWASIEAFASDRRRLPWRATLLVVVFPSVVFFLSQGRPLMTGDSKPNTLIASALVLNGSTDLSAFIPEYASVYRPAPGMVLPYFCLRTATGVYSAYHSGMFVFALPSAALAHLLGSELLSGGVLDRMEKSVASILSALCLGLFFLLALHLVDARSAGWMTFLLATGSGLCSTVGQALWQHGGVLFWMLLALLIEFRISHTCYPGSSWKRTMATLIQGLALALMFACRLPSAVLIAAFGIWLLFRAPRRAVCVGLAAVMAFVPWAWYYYSIYGTVLGPSIRQAGMFTGSWRDTFIPLLFSPDHGLLVYQPWILLGLVMVLPSVRRCLPAATVDAPKGLNWLCIAVILPYLLLIASWYCWWGGQCWGSRLLVELVPFFALMCLPIVAALRRLEWGRRLLLAIALLAAFVQLPGVYLKVDFRDTQPALFGACAEPPGSWKHWPFLTPFVGALHGYR